MIWAQNNLTNSSNVDIEITNEFVDGIFIKSLTKTIAIPPSLGPGTFNYLYLFCHTADGSDADVVFLYPATPTYWLTHWRVIGAWGTEPRSKSAMIQMQHDSVVVFRGDFDFDQGLLNFNTNGNWQSRAAQGGFPPLCCAVYFRGEAWPTNGDGGAQVNVGTPDGQYHTQSKGYGTSNGTGPSTDWLRCPIYKNDQHFGVMVSAPFKADLLFSGFELVI